mgnify:CR=1 FL=1
MQHIGLAQTMDFIMRKKIVSAHEALDLGLVNDVVANESLVEKTRELAQELAEGPQVSMRLMKRSLYLAAELSFEQACEDIASRTAISDHHPDSQEGVSAFHDKRQPKFNDWLTAWTPPEYILCRFSILSSPSDNHSPPVIPNPGILVLSSSLLSNKAKVHVITK